MAVTANQLIKRQAGCKASYPVEEATHLYQGTLVFINAAGFAVGATATGVNGFAGIAIEEVDNSAGGDGDKRVEVWTDGDFELVGAGTYSQADVGSIAYAEDNYAIGVAIDTASVPIGRVVDFVSTTKLIVRIKPNGVGTLPVAPLTAITIADAAGTPEYTMASFTNSSAWGFAAEDEVITFAYVVQNLQARVAALESRAL